MEVVGQGRSEEGEGGDAKLKKEVIMTNHHAVEEEKNTFKFNVDAPEFIPSSYAFSPTSTSTSTPSSLQGFCYYFDPWFNFPGHDGTCGSGSSASAQPSDWICFPDDEPPRSSVDSAIFSHSNYNGRGGGGSCGAGAEGEISPRYSGNSSEAAQKIVKQVEYQFTDSQSDSNDHKNTNKDSDGYVPITAIISQKKMKALGCNNFVLTKALRTSPNLDVSEDGKKVRKKVVLSEKEREEFQLRTVVVENLPEECNRQKVEKIFSTVGSIRSVKICHPSEPASSSPKSSSYKSDILVSNKVHALVEYENSEQAEKAVERLNDSRNWRKGLRVRVMRRRSPRSVMRNRRGGDRDHYFNNEISDEEEEGGGRGEDDVDERKQMVQQQKQVTTDNERAAFKLSSHHIQIEGTSLGKMMRSKSLGRVKSRGIPGRGGALSPTNSGPVACNYLVRSESSNKLLGPRRVGSNINGMVGELTKQSPWGPRMPDGTRGFAMGRGRRPITPTVPTGFPT